MGRFSDRASLDAVPLAEAPAAIEDLFQTLGAEDKAALRAELAAVLEDMAPEERSSCLCAAARTAADISLLCAMILEIAPDPDGSSLVDALPEWKTVLLDRIGALAAAGTFWAQRDPAALLWFWFVHGEAERVYHFTRRAMDEPEGLAALLTIPLERAGAGEDAPEIVAVRRWSRIVDFQTLESRALAAAMAAPSRDERRRARRFLDAFGAGKSELFR